MSVTTCWSFISNIISIAYPHIAKGPYLEFCWLFKISSPVADYILYACFIRGVYQPLRYNAVEYEHFGSFCTVQSLYDLRDRNLEQLVHRAIQYYRFQSLVYLRIYISNCT